MFSHYNDTASPIAADMNHECADADLQLDVDLLSLDFLLHAAIKAVLEDRRSQQYSHLAADRWTDHTERAITSVDSKSCDHSE